MAEEAEVAVPKDRADPGGGETLAISGTGQAEQ
jgi:hypothetical protein